MIDDGNYLEFYIPNEIPSKEFFKFECQNQSKKICAMLKDCTTNDQSMASAINFFKTLYQFKQSDSTATESLLQNLPTITKEKIKHLSCEITKEEVLFAIKQNNSSSSPGLDGFLFQFYKAFSDECSTILLKIQICLVCWISNWHFSDRKRVLGRTTPESKCLFVYLVKKGTVWLREDNNS